MPGARSDDQARTDHAVDRGDDLMLGRVRAALRLTSHRPTHGDTARQQECAYQVHSSSLWQHGRSWLAERFTY
jgi:hypothetical protein